MVVLMRSIPSILYIELNPVAFRKVKIVYNFGLSECSRVNGYIFRGNKSAILIFLSYSVGLTLKRKNLLL